ncbi:MAG: AraC family transcriptional regulator [Myxococcales bacterium]
MKNDALDQDSSLVDVDPARGLSIKARVKGDGLERIDNYYWVNKLLRLHQELPFWILHWDGKKGLTWMDLNEVVGRVQPFHFEIHFGKKAKRDDYYWESLKRAGRDRDFVVGELMGFNDFFYALPTDPRGRTFLYGGQFLTEELGWDGIAWRWRELTGQLPDGANLDFMRFVRMALRIPVIEAPVLKALEELLALLSELVSTDHADVKLHERVKKLRREVFDRAWPNNDWVDRATSSEEFLLTPWYHEGKREDWRSEEMGICRLPTTAMALMPVYPKNQTLDPVQTMVNNARIQRACIRFASQMPETGANRLQDYGVSILTSAAPGKSAARAKLELRDRAQKLQAFVKEKFDVDTVVGVGRTLPPGEPLYPSHHDAVLALHLCVQLEKDILVCDEKGTTNDGVRNSFLNRAAAELSEAFDRVATDEIKLASDQYVRLVLVWSTERIEVVRSQFLSMLFTLIKNIQKRHLLRSEVAEHLADDLSQKIEEAPSVYRVIETFKDALARLSVFASRALEGPKSMRLDTTLQYLKDNFAEPLRLTSVARKAGFSVPAFSRIFKQATGTSFLVYLRNIRVEHAKMLLRTSNLSAEQVAQACGFQSQHHLIRSFKKVSKSTPGNYRKDMQTRAARPSTSQD